MPPSSGHDRNLRGERGSLKVDETFVLLVWRRHVLYAQHLVGVNNPRCGPVGRGRRISPQATRGWRAMERAMLLIAHVGPPCPRTVRVSRVV